MVQKQQDYWWHKIGEKRIPTLLNWITKLLQQAEMDRLTKKLRNTPHKEFEDDWEKFKSYLETRWKQTLQPDERKEKKNSCLEMSRKVKFISLTGTAKKGISNKPIT